MEPYEITFDTGNRAIINLARVEDVRWTAPEGDPRRTLKITFAGYADDGTQPYAEVKDGPEAQQFWDYLLKRADKALVAQGIFRCT